jgi:hypothetical protein
MDQTKVDPSTEPEQVIIILQPMKSMGLLHFCGRCNKYVGEGPCNSEAAEAACAK